MRDLVLIAHILIGLALIVLPVLILRLSSKKSLLLKPLAGLAAILSWLLLLPAGILYIMFYPATKTLIKSGPYPWLHSILMETKEHYGLLLPLIATLAAYLVFTNKTKESRKWWILLIVISLLIGILGRLLKIGAIA